MQDEPFHLTCEIELKPGEKLILPAQIADSIGPGRWLVTVQNIAPAAEVPRRHSAFLNGYSPEDEGLYDDYPGR